MRRYYFSSDACLRCCAAHRRLNADVDTDVAAVTLIFDAAAVIYEARLR